MFEFAEISAPLIPLPFTNQASIFFLLFMYIYDEIKNTYFYMYIVYKVSLFYWSLKKIERKGMTFDHNFGHSFVLFSSLLKKRGKKAFLLDP